MKDKKINHQIKYKTLKLVDTDGKCYTTSIADAQRKANEYGLDLVEIKPPKGSDLGLCKILDYGKMKYEEKKKNKNSNKNKTIVKEIKVHFTTDQHDINIKNNKIKDFLDKKYLVNYVMELKGRDMRHFDEAYMKFKDQLSSFDEKATWEKINSEKHGYKGKIFVQLKSKL